MKLVRRAMLFIFPNLLSRRWRTHLKSRIVRAPEGCNLQTPAGGNVSEDSMKGRLFFPLVVMVGFLAVAVPVFAHHGRATYDETKLATIMGTVSSFQFSNPHAQLFLDVKDDKGKIEKWIGEGTSPNMLVR